MEPGQIFAEQYRIVEEVGRGSYGIVYRGEDLETGKPVALKFLLPWAENDETARRRFEREAKYGQSLNHPAIVRVERYGHTPEGKPYMIMEYVEGRSLDKVLADENRLSLERATRIARQVLSALEEAHAQGIIHRDLKAENLVLCPGASSQEEQVKVFDFGIAKAIDGAPDTSTGNSSFGRLTMTGTTLGTVHYMSPEQIEGDDLTPASDFYSLGVVLYETVTGRLPYDSQNPVEVMIMHSSAPVPTLPQSIASTPMGTAITRALQKDPGDRPGNCAEFHALLDDEPAEISASPEPPPTAPSSPRDGWGFTVQRLLARYWLALVIAALLLILIVSQL